MVAVAVDPVPVPTAVRDQVLIGHHHKASGVASGDRVNGSRRRRRRGEREKDGHIYKWCPCFVFWSREKGYKLFRITKEERERDRLEGISNIKLYISIYTMSKLKGCLCLTRPEELEGHDQEGHSELAKRSRTLHGVNSRLHVPDDGGCLTRTFNRLPFGS